MVADIDPHVIGITESWANKDIVDAELALTGYVMFRKEMTQKYSERLLMLQINKVYRMIYIN